MGLWDKLFDYQFNLILNWSGFLMWYNLTINWEVKSIIQSMGDARVAYHSNLLIYCKSWPKALTIKLKATAVRSGLRLFMLRYVATLKDRRFAFIYVRKSNIPSDMVCPGLFMRLLIIIMRIMIIMTIIIMIIQKGGKLSYWFHRDCHDPKR